MKGEKDKPVKELPWGRGKAGCWACGGVGVQVIEREEYACFVCCPVKTKKKKAKK